MRLPVLVSCSVFERLRRSLLRAAVMMSLAATSPLFSAGQTVPKRALITQPVEESKLTVLRGNRYPLARAEYDRGPAPASLPMQRMLLVLKRSPELETALEALLDQQQDKSSPNFHAWLTPEQFGQQFGPADEDIQAISSWLQLQGFQIAHVSNGRTVIEFSGTAAQVQNAFHTEMRKYSVNGKDHWANASDPQIPTALVPAVAGILTLHNFPRHAMNNLVGTFKRSKSTSALTPAGPLFTLPNFIQNTTFYGVGPYDFATIYNVSPLWNATPPIIGTGQTIAIVGETDIQLADVEQFRRIFGLPFNDPVVIVDGPDPGEQKGDEVESDLDVEWSGAIAPNATIDFVIAATTDTTLGVDLAAQYIVDHNVAAIVSESYGICEAALGTAGNQFYLQLWQQAAAQGMSVFLASGDSGSAGCDRGEPAQFGLQVSGFASTPYTTTVGGTDFNDLNNFAVFWNATNDAHQASAKSYIPEMTWNDSCTNTEWSIITGLTTAESNCNNQQVLQDGGIIAAGASGGKSGCTMGDGQDITSCSGGYPKPSWQAGAGVPTDGKRDIPDISLFASDGFNGTFYVMCSQVLTIELCDPNSPSTNIVGVGGTSASAPSFAGIMALVLQKTNSRQGNPNYTLYKLAAQQSAANCNSSTAPASTCVFYDVTAGTIAMPCVTGSTVDCHTNIKSDQFGVLTGYTTTTAYDLATGLGTVNAANLVNAWATAAAGSKGSVTTLMMTPSPLTITHGATANLSVTVAPAPGGSGTPSGEVALQTSTGLGVASFLLTNGAVTGTTGNLPGGNYTIFAHYPGDSTFSPSDSSKVSVTVTPEASTTTVKVLTKDANGNPIPFTSGPYGSFMYVRADVAAQSGNGTPTGSVTIKDNGTPVDGSPYALNSQGNTATPNGIFTLSGGQNTITATYSGDASFTPGPAASTNITITPAATKTTMSGVTPVIPVGTAMHLNASVTGNSCGNPAKGTVTFFTGTTKLASATLVSSVDPEFCTVAGIVDIVDGPALPLGNNSLTAQYSGDGNYAASTSAPMSVDAVIPTTTAIMSSATTINQFQSVTFTANVTANQSGGPAMTGSIQFTSNALPTPLCSAAISGGQAMCTTSALPGGPQFITATYTGDTFYQTSNSQLSETVNPAPDFAVVANPNLISISKPGQSGSTSLMLTAMNGLTGTFNLAPQCAGLPSESTCSVSPTSITFSSTMTTASVMLTISTTAPSNIAPNRRPHSPGAGIGMDAATAISLLALSSLLGLLRKRRKFEFVLSAFVFAALLTFAACGGGGGGGGVHDPGTPVGLDPNASVSLTLGLATHSLPFSVNVQ